MTASLEARDPLAVRVVRVRRVRLFCVLLARGRPLSFPQIRWLAERDPILSRRWLIGDLRALVELGLVTRCRLPGARPDYAPSLAARRNVKP